MTDSTLPTDAPAGEALGVPALDPRDAAALEALVESGFDLDGLNGAERARAERITSFLAMLTVNEVGDARTALVDATLARVARQRAREQQGPVLSADDEEAIEALVGVGFRLDHVPRVLQRRAERAATLLGALDAAPADLDGLDVRAATLERVQTAVESEQSRMVLTAAEPPEARRLRFRLADLVSVAALLLIGASVALPMIGALRHQAGRIGCASGLQAAGAAFSQYSTDYNNGWAMASASPAGGTWWNFGQPDASNSANLFTIARTGYTTLDDLACPGNDHAVRGQAKEGQWDWRQHEQISYAYQNLFAAQRPDIAGSTRVVIMADKSPVVVLSRQHRQIDPFANSPNHAGRGQNILHSDGKVLWVQSPVLESGDNLWLPRAIEQVIRSAFADPLQGHESPASDDVMAVP